MADKGFVDFHIHSTRSDGRYTPEEVTDLAAESGVTVMALTDHNMLSPDIDQLMERHAGRLTILRGCEISCRHKFASGETKEIHVVALMYGRRAPHLEELLKRNRKHNREEYISAILRKLKENCGIDIGTYEELCAEAGESEHVGRMHVAQKLKNFGFVRTIDEGFDVYIGDFGLKKAYVESGIEYADMKEAVQAALSDGAVPVLAHLYYYRLTQTQQDELLETFKEYAGGFGAMETEYARYSEEQRAILRSYADKYRLAKSCGSDFHGFADSETLRNGFPYELYEGLLERKRRLDED